MRCYESMSETTKTRYWTLDGAADNGTVGEAITKTTAPDRTQTTAVLLTHDASNLRHRVAALRSDVARTHQQTYENEWDVETQMRAKQSPVALLEELSSEGFAWNDVARLLGVSVPAVKKWRNGERLTGSNRSKLARLVAAFDLLRIHFLVEDIASWMETPLREDVPVTPIDLWIAGPPKLFFDYGSRHATVDQTLDSYDPEWRERFRSAFETFRDADGNLGLRMTD